MSSESLDADLYGDLYETDFADQAADEKPTETIKQHAKTQVPVDSEPAESPQVKPLANIDVSSHSTHSPTNAQTSFPVAQQIPTFEDPATANYRTSAPLGQVYQNMASSEQRPVRPSEMKDDGKMFIGGLNWDTTDDGLRAYFEQFGKVDACTIMRDAVGRSRCFAFLTFEDPASVNAVMVKEHVLDGKVIDPKRAIPRQEHQRATKLFIGGLAGTVTSESMREFFSQFGRVVDSTVMLDRDTGRSKGFGFISLEDADVQPFLGFGNLEIDGKLIDVKLAQPRYQRDTFQEDQQNGGNEGGFTNRNGGYNNNFQAGAGTAAGGNFNGGAAVGAAGSPFDPQALAALYTRMFQMAGGAMNPMMGMNPMMAMRNNMAMGAMGNMPVGRGGMVGGGAGGNGPPRGPRNASPSNGMGPAGVGPARSARGGHTYHPYGRS